MSSDSRSAGSTGDADFSRLFDLSRRVGIVTGGAGIIGKDLVRGLLAHGASVVVADIDAAAGRAFLDSLRPEFEGRVLSIPTDVADPASVAGMVSSTVDRFGKIDFLLNNAALFGTNPKDYYAPFEDYSLDEWRRIMAVDLDGVFLVAREVGKQMVAQASGGSIVQTASIYGVM